MPAEGLSMCVVRALLRVHHGACAGRHQIAAAYGLPRPW